ncbi:MAG: dethiobiotin synthase [Gammaproteobacteria bacterium]|nr:dethiobiotin synthase [Gammaproteobacteria bacterium]
MTGRLDCFVTGTDTGVGKTWVSAGLMHGLSATGLRVAGMKPVASGCRKSRRGPRNDDAEILRSLASIPVDYALVNPVPLPEPIAPHIAAARAGVVIDMDAIRAAFRQLQARADAVVVEGIGGWRVPLSEARSTADLVRELGLPAVLVVGLRLGCINHALLSVESIAASAVTLAGWVANHLLPDYSEGAETVNYLSERIAAPLIGVVPYLEQRDPERIATALSVELLSAR